MRAGEEVLVPNGFCPADQDVVMRNSHKVVYWIYLKRRCYEYPRASFISPVKNGECGVLVVRTIHILVCPVHTTGSISGALISNVSTTQAQEARLEAEKGEELGAR